MSIYRDIRDTLLQGYDAGEASAIAFLLLEEVAGIDKTHALMGDESPMRGELLDMALSISKGEPVQYVIGKAEFCGLTFHVEPGVLIPRPETEELVQSVSLPDEGTLRIVDIGTGSGCIAVSLAKRFPNAQVEGWDISDEALRIAAHNAQLNDADVTFRKVDVLNVNAEDVLDFYAGDKLSAIVSNPPYICEREKASMEANVLEHEPHLALFVPDDDPLLFYRKIAELGIKLLQSGGLLCYEINRAYGNETLSMLQTLGYADVVLRKDQFGNDRVVCAIKP